MSYMGVERIPIPILIAEKLTILSRPESMPLSLKHPAVEGYRIALT